MTFTKEEGKLIQVMSEIQSRLIYQGIYSIHEYLENNFVEVPVIFNEEEEIKFEQDSYGYPLVHYLDFNAENQELHINYIDEMFDDELDIFAFFNGEGKFENIVVYSIENNYMFVIDEEGVFFIEEV